MDHAGRGNREIKNRFNLFISSILPYFMRISIFSDLHLGFGRGTERENDCFDAFEEALEKSLDADLILIPGDIFDIKNPSTETMAKAMELLLNMIIIKNDVKLVSGIGKDISRLSPVNTFGIPIIALHGNHERKAKGLINPVQAMEKAGFLIHLHCNGVVLEKNGERVAVQGISSVPDKYFTEILKEWNPKPVEGCFNIFMLHQILGEFFGSPDSLKTSSLPPGFDLYIDGDIHKPQQSTINGKPLIIAGSLIPTQLSEDDTGPRGVWFIDTETSSIRFVRLENQRKFYFEKFEKADKEAIEKRITEIISRGHKKKPIIRIKVDDKLEWEKEIKAKYDDKAIISFKQILKEEDEIRAKTLEEHKLSVQELAKKLLRENLEKFNLNPKVFETVFELITEGKNEDALSFLKSSVNKSVINAKSEKADHTKQDKKIKEVEPHDDNKERTEHKTVSGDLVSNMNFDKNLKKLEEKPDKRGLERFF